MVCAPISVSAVTDAEVGRRGDLAYTATAELNRVQNGTSACPNQRVQVPHFHSYDEICPASLSVLTVLQLSQCGRGMKAIAYSSRSKFPERTHQTIQIDIPGAVAGSD